MPDYVTREEFNAAIEAMRVVGDQQTIDVDHTPGGQTVRSIQVIGDDAPSSEVEDIEYMVITFDSDTKEVVITITDLPVLSPIRDEYALDATLKVNATSTQRVRLYVRESRDTDNVNPYEIVLDVNEAIITDSDTLDRLVDKNAHRNRIFADLTVYSYQAPIVAFQPTNGKLSFTANLEGNPFIDVSASGIWLQNFTSPFQSFGPVATGGVTNNPLSYSGAVVESLILGFNYGTAGLTFDYFSNKASYDRYIGIGEIEIDGDGKVLKADYNPEKSMTASVPMFGINGSFTISDGDSILVQQGVIVGITQP